MNAQPGVTLLLGGARSGKSDLAIRLAAASGLPVTFIATADVREDGDLAARVARHRAERPAGWTTAEAPHELAAAVRRAAQGDLVVIDCVTIWVSNRMAAGLDEDGANAIADDLLEALGARTTPSIVVTNEVGMGVHPSSPVGREYRDVLGRVNRRLSEGASRAMLVVAGRVLPLLSADDALR